MRDEYLHRLETAKDKTEIYEVADILIPYLVKHSSEVDAIDLLAEIDALDRILPYIDKDNYKRICLYISTSADYSADPEEMRKTLNVCFHAYLRAEKFPEALRIALKINRPEYVQEAMNSCQDPIALK